MLVLSNFPMLELAIVECMVDYFFKKMDGPAAGTEQSGE